MTENIVQNEKTELIKYIPPKGEFTRFLSDEDYLEKGRTWGLFNKNPKHDFLFKGQDFQVNVKLVGYETYGVTDEYHTIIIEFEDGNLTCIHPAYLKEMQSPSFKKVYTVGESDTKNSEEKKSESETVTKSKESTSKATTKKKVEKKEEVLITLPTDKSHFNGTIKEFSTKYNHFNDSEEEIVIWENVAVKGDQDLVIGNAWCSLSKTLKAAELEVGKSYQFDGKVVDKKLNKEVKYKLNNPSKVVEI
ncbi:hypothetical protein BED47_02275 [Gottfriedia luciferensis]|uniref:Uncharacterized protein n=1 Tax=Gottfriedia luciferensis TaxID=178774 RepID=A0ABX2ZWT9_9BACI|nr:hypothetical protein [Gottfriedia luciferensis]ODG94018.1 hypothetical protein BED47_02275 [Gottfriedia luciferensis]